MITQQELNQILGVPQKVDWWPEITDEQYHKKEEGLSSSVLKDYLKDPLMTAQQRLYKVAEMAPPGRSSLEAFRLGSALHCIALEGDAEFEKRFAVFSGQKRQGANWTKFKKENADAIADNRVLSRAEHDSIMEWVPATKKAIQSVLTPYEQAGFVCLSRFTEAGLRIQLPNGIRNKIKMDGGALMRHPERGFLFVVFDVKTTSKSVTSPLLANAVDDSHYDLSACDYATTLQAAMFVNNFAGQGIGQIIPVVFNLLWISKLSKMTRYHTIYDTRKDGPWEIGGRTKFLAAMTNYCREGQHILNMGKEAAYREMHAPLNPAKWYRKNLEQYDYDTDLLSRPTAPESQIRAYLTSLK